MRCIIFCYSEAKKINFKFKRNDFVICADIGLETALKMDVMPNLVVGDFDSININQYAFLKTEIIALPSQKDETDTFFALKTAFSRGYKDFVLIGGLHGRLDHTYANIELLRYIYQNGGNGYIYDDDTKITYVKGGETVVYPNDVSCQFISVFPVNDRVEGVTLKNLKFELDNYTLIFGSPIGVSNEFIGKDAEISCINGDLFVMQMY